MLKQNDLDVCNGMKFGKIYIADEVSPVCRLDE